MATIITPLSIRGKIHVKRTGTTKEGDAEPIQRPTVQPQGVAGGGHDSATEAGYCDPSDVRQGRQ